MPNHFHHVPRATTRWFPQLALSLVLIATALAPFAATDSSAEPVENDAFWNVWARTDLPVSEGRVDRTWMWGPEGYSRILSEPYADAPGGERTVQYFDKARMEINDPGGDQSDSWHVTNGLLARDLILGQVQVGDDDVQSFAPPEINVAGDFDDPTGPTYQTFHGVMTAEPLPVGTAIDQTIDRSGSVQSDDSLAGQGVTAEHIEPATDHAVASVFWDFMNSAGTVYRDGAFTNDRLFGNPYYATGYPLTEAYWSQVRVEGQPKDVLIQVFERRVLTYTPDNPVGWKVESGNVGLHYYHWYYGTLSSNSPEPAPPDPTEPPDPDPSGSAGDAASCLNSFEREFLAEINDYRQRNGLSTLENSETLNVSSYNHSQDMGERNYFSHVTPEGEEPWDRMADAGYDYNTKMAENIAVGYRSARDVFEGWRESEGHNRTMLDPDLAAIGIGRVEVPGSQYDVSWTTNFGGHVDAAPDC